MDEEIQKYLNTLMDETLKAQPSLNKNALLDYYSDVILKTLVDNLSDEQLAEVEKLDFESPEAESKLALLAAQIPGFIFKAEEVLKLASAQIKQTGQIPT